MKGNRMVELLSNLVPEEGVRQDVIDRVDLFRITGSSPRTPQTYDPGIIILAQGEKEIFIGDDFYTYGPGNYLVLSVPLPLECKTSASEEKPLLGFKVKVDPAIVGEILLQSDNAGDKFNSLLKGIGSARLDSGMLDASERLLEAISQSEGNCYLGSLIVKEIIYRVLTGEKGDLLRALAYRNQRFFRIAHVLDKIHESYNSKLDMNLLALEAGMSISAFHSSFKAVTNSSPLQYIKNVRLHKARMLMIEEGISAYNAAIHVGYESPSQFNREYKRLFGLTPGRDAGSNESRIDLM